MQDLYFILYLVGFLRSALLMQDLFNNLHAISHFRNQAYSFWDAFPQSSHQMSC